ncbi:MAG: hypothetical protein ABI268_04140 [Rhodanobacter sp.]
MNIKSPAVEQDPWDSGDLGRSVDHVGVVSEAECRAIDGSLGLHPVSIRLEKSLIASLKLIAELRGVSYQPLIRDLLNRFVESELKAVMHEQAEQARRRVERQGGLSEAVDEFFERERKHA